MCQLYVDDVLIESAGWHALQDKVAELSEYNPGNPSLDASAGAVQDKLAEDLARGEVIAATASEIGTLALHCKGPKRNAWPLHGKHCTQRRVQSAILEAADRLQ